MGNRVFYALLNLPTGFREEPAVYRFNRSTARTSTSANVNLVTIPRVTYSAGTTLFGEMGRREGENTCHLYCYSGPKTVPEKKHGMFTGHGAARHGTKFPASTKHASQMSLGHRSRHNTHSKKICTKHCVLGRAQ